MIKMGGAFALIFGLIGLAIAAGMGDKSSKTKRDINRLDAIDNAAHYYNHELQDKLEWVDVKRLEELSGMNYLELNRELSKEHSVYLDPVIKHMMIKKIVNNFGYDYKLMLNSNSTKYVNNKNGYGGHKEDSPYYNL